MRTRIVVAAFVALLLSTVAHAAEIKVLSTQAVEGAYRELVPQFEKASGHKVTTIFTGTLDAQKRIAAGETYDLIIMAGPAIDDLIKSGKVAPGSRVDLARSGVGVAVRAGAPKPDIHSTEALKKTLLAAKSIGYSSGPSGVYLADLLRRLGIADQVKSKLKQTPTGVFVGSIHRQRGGRDRLPAGQRAVALSRHRLRGAAAGRHPERDGLLERDADWGDVGRGRQGMDHLPDIPGRGGRVQEQEHGSRRRATRDLERFSQRCSADLWGEPSAGVPAAHACAVGWRLAREPFPVPDRRYSRNGARRSPRSARRPS